MTDWQPGPGQHPPGALANEGSPPPTTEPNSESTPFECYINNQGFTLASAIQSARPGDVIFIPFTSPVFTNRAHDGFCCALFRPLETLRTSQNLTGTPDHPTEKAETC